MKKFISIFAAGIMMLTLAGEAFARCDTPDDRAADGSRCGGRSATSRPGGR